MRRFGLLALSLCGCVDLTTPRAYQCDPGGNTLEESVRQANCRSSPSSSWYCALDGFCRDRAQPSSRECEADTHCPTNHRCLPTEDSVRVRRCRSVDQQGAFRCRADAGDSDCGPSARCSFEGLCRPMTAQAFTCRRDAGDADCEGGWRCGLDAVCRAPIGGPNRCATDLDCDDGWRCGGERCVDPRDEQLVPLVQPQPPVKLNPLVDFFRDGGGLLLVSPPANVREGQTRLVFREGLPFHRVDQAGELVLVDMTGVTPRLRPGWRSTLGPAGLLQVSGSQLEFTLGSDGGTSLVDAGYRLTSARALWGPSLQGLFGWTIDDGPVSAAVISNGHETRFLPDAGVHLVGMAAISKPGCAPAFVTWSTTTLYLVTSDGGFRPTTVMTSGSDLERVTIEALADGGAVAAKRAIVDVHTGEGSLTVVYHQASQLPPVEDVDGGVEASAGMIRVAALAPSGCGLSGAVTDVEACPNAPGARLTAALSVVDGAGLDVQRVCASGAIEWRYARNQFVVGQRTLTAQNSGSFAVALRSGVLTVGQGPSALIGTTTSEPIQTVIDDVSGLTLFTNDRSYSTSTPLGLATTLAAKDPTTLIRARLPFGRCCAAGWCSTAKQTEASSSSEARPRAPRSSTQPPSFRLPWSRRLPVTACGRSRSTPPNHRCCRCAPAPCLASPSPRWRCDHTRQAGPSRATSSRPTGCSRSTRRRSTA